MALSLMFINGCATRDHSTTNTSDQPWDRPLQNDQPSFKPAGDPANPGAPRP
ncbi:MAG: hypothetical protein JWQ04_1082 [Pedosphaera sp.]|nr:hypothetical protein [Pedosphaera sp.]